MDENYGKLALIALGLAIVLGRARVKQIFPMFLVCCAGLFGAAYLYGGPGVVINYARGVAVAVYPRISEVWVPVAPPQP